MLKIFIFIILLISLKLQAAPRCVELFNELPVIDASMLRFNQNFLGHKWSEFKLIELNEEFLQTDFNKNQRQEFLLDKTKPLPVIRDVMGNFRLIDSNHSLFSYTEFIGKKTSFNVHVKVIKDFTIGKKNGLRWSIIEMMDYLKKKHWVHFYDKELPTFSIF